MCSSLSGERVQLDSWGAGSLVWTAARVRLGLSGSALWNRRQSRCKEKRPGDFHRAVSVCV